MKVGQNTVVRFHCRMTDEEGHELATTPSESPETVLFGAGSLVKGLEAAMRGRAAEETFEVTVPPEQAYGLYRPEWTERVSKKVFTKPKKLKAGTIETVQTKNGPREVKVLKVGAKIVEVDLNHPLAGKCLNFSVQIVEVREASPLEISHGHAHGEGGHQH